MAVYQIKFSFKNANDSLKGHTLNFFNWSL